MPIENMRFGLCVWNDWGDNKTDRPDNIAELTTANIINWLHKNNMTEQDGRKVYQFQPFNHNNDIVFEGASADDRRRAYSTMLDVHTDKLEYPTLDYLLVRYRWDLGIPGDKRVEYQDATLAHYIDTSTKIFIWDEDFQMSSQLREKYSMHENVELVEISEAAIDDDMLTYIPHMLDIDATKALANVLGPHATNNGDHFDTEFLLAYIGNNYEREETLSRYLEHIASAYPKQVHLFGNWLKYDERVRDEYPNIAFHTKVGKVMTAWLYQHSVAVPMLAKEVYFRRGHIVPRLAEVIQSGGIPIGFSEFKNAAKYFHFIASNDIELEALVTKIKGFTLEERRDALKQQIALLEENNIFSVSGFFECLGVK